jgi:phage baseplate assembly protein W
VIGVRTLALYSGDLMLAQGGYQLYSGVDRIRQDLQLALREEYGSDRFHPKWGSIIMRYIGQIQSPHLEALVRAEINRVLQNYIAVQNAEVLRDSQVDVKNRFTTSDVVRRVTGLVTNMHLDRIDVALALETLSREVVKIKKQVTL